MFDVVVVGVFVDDDEDRDLSAKLLNGFPPALAIVFAGKNLIDIQIIFDIY